MLAAKGKLERSWDLATEHLRALAAVVFAIYMPLYLADALTISMGWLPDEAADKLFSLVGLFLMPIANGAVVTLVHHWYSGTSASMIEAFKAARRAWSRLLTAYVSVGFILMAWLALTVLPAYILLSVFKVNQPLYLIPVAGIAGALALSRYAFLEPLIVIEGLSPWAARQRSKELAKKRRLKVIGYGLVTFVPPFALETGGELLADHLKPGYGQFPILLEAATGLAASLLYVLPVIFFYIYYRELTSGAKEDLHADAR